MRPRPFAVPLFAAVALSAATLLGSVLAPGVTGAAEAPAGSSGGPTDAGFAAGSANLSRIWWNQPRAVEVLGLTADQRRAMDALLLDHLGSRRELARESFEMRRRLGDHLAAGDWEAAEKAAGELAERAGALARGDAELTLAVVRLLEPAQRRTLDEELPMILRRPWLQGGMGLRQGRLPRQGAPRRPPGE